MEVSINEWVGKRCLERELRAIGYDLMVGGKGIYTLAIDNVVVYVGKSKHLFERLLEHIREVHRQKEKKYQILNEAVRDNRKVSFKVIEYVKKEDDLTDRERFWIKAIDPELNTWWPIDEDGNEKKWRRREIECVNAEMAVNGRKRLKK